MKGGSCAIVFCGNDDSVTDNVVVCGYGVSVLKQDVTKLHRVGFEIHSGEHHTFLGTKGSGKSLLIKALLELTPYDGEIKWAVSDKDKMRLVRAVLQNQPLEKRLKVKEICLLHRMLLKSDMSVETLLSTFELDRIKDCFAEDLKKGDEKLLQIALAVMSKPKVLVLDSVEDGLDDVSKQTIWTHLKRLKKEEKITLIMTSNELNAFVKQSDQLVILDEGKVVGRGKTDEIVERLYRDSKKALFLPTQKFLYTKFEFPFTRKKAYLEVSYTQEQEKRLYENIIECGGEEVHFTKFTIEDALIHMIGYDLLEKRL